MARTSNWLVVVGALLVGFVAGALLVLGASVASALPDPLGGTLIFLDLLVFVACGAVVAVRLRRAGRSDLVYVGATGVLVGWVTCWAVIALLRHLRELLSLGPAG